MLFYKYYCYWIKNEIVEQERYWYSNINFGKGNICRFIFLKRVYTNKQKYSSNYTGAHIQVLQNQYGIEFTQAIEQQLVEEVSTAINREIIRRIIDIGIGNDTQNDIIPFQ